MKKRVIAIGTIVLGIVLGCVITLRAADDLNLERPKPICYDDPALGEERGTCKSRVGGGMACVLPAEDGRDDCTGDSYDLPTDDQ